MKLLPIRSVPLASELPPAALVDRLRGVVGDGSAAPFAGAVSADGFVITRLNEFRSTVMPLLIGNFVPRPDGGTGVLLRLRPSGTVIVFMGIWLAFLAVVAAIIVIAHARDAGRSLAALLAPAGLGVATWYLMASIFDADSRWAVEHFVASVPALHPGDGLTMPGTSRPGGASITRI